MVEKNIGKALRMEGVAASEGVAIGPVFVHDVGELEPERTSITEEEVEDEIKRFDEAVEAVVPKLSETAEKMRDQGNENEAAIFDAHTELAQDPELADGVKERVKNLESPEAAIMAVGEEYAQMFANMEDEYMAARADDVRDVARQIAAEVMGEQAAGLESLDEPSVILAKSLAPSDTARVPKGMALGFVTAEGSKTSHVSIMARSMGIPAVVGVGSALEEAFEAETVAINGGEGYAIADPDEATISDIEKREKELEEERKELEEYKHVEGRTSDGRRIEVSANLGSAKDAEDALEWGAEGVGLFRTEFLFMERDQLPTEDEQYDVYRQVVEAFGEKPVIFRTLDVGGRQGPPRRRPTRRREPVPWLARHQDVFGRARAIQAPAKSTAARGGPRQPEDDVPDGRKRRGSASGERADRRVPGRVGRCWYGGWSSRCRGDGRDAGGGYLRLRSCEGSSFLLSRHQRPGPVHAGRRPGQRASATPSGRGPSGGAEADRPDLRGRRRGWHLGRGVRRGRRRPGPRSEANRARGQGALHERAVYPQSEEGGVRDLRM